VATAFLRDIEALNSAGKFSASFIVQAATGTKVHHSLSERFRTLPGERMAADIAA
jgi:hypothetical protein